MLTATEVLDLFRSVDLDVNKLAEIYPEANEWFIAEGYRFEFGIVGEMYLIHNDSPTESGHKVGRYAASDLLSEELERRVDAEVRPCTCVHLFRDHDDDGECGYVDCGCKSFEAQS